MLERIAATGDSRVQGDGLAPGDTPAPGTPFVVQHRREALRGGDFTPSARLILTPALRASGLWAALPPEEFRDLILILTFLTPNGWCRPTLTELADAMGVPARAAGGRLGRLTARQWRGGPLAVPLPRQGGPDAYAPGRQLLAHEQADPPEDRGQPTPARTAGREAVLTYSRARYARTRREVEAEIAERMGWGPPPFEGEDPETAARKGALYGRMEALGVAREQALDLLARHDPDRVERQLDWIGHRGAKNPARYLAAAIEGDYEMPLGLRARQAPHPGPGNGNSDGAGND